jgi:predicted SprT family Zn-dependent metalloprotease
MDLDTLRDFAELKLREHGLEAQGWLFCYDRARARFGSCVFGEKRITISRPLAERNDESACYDTVLHEIAHALAGEAAGHGPRWKAICRRIGANPVRCYLAGEVSQPDPHFWSVCPHCARRVPHFRRPRRIRACGACCRAHNGGRYDERFRMKVEMVKRSG